jgi:hypothetical protein
MSHKGLRNLSKVGFLEWGLHDRPPAMDAFLPTYRFMIALSQLQ